MIKKVETTIKICDICKKKVDEFAHATETSPSAITDITKEVYYGGNKKLDVCRKCSDKILRYLETLENSKQD